MSDNCPKVFISYCWEDEEHKKWVRELADRLLFDGIDVTIDQYDLELGDRLTQFMEQNISEAKYVLIICTPKYKEKVDKRTGGVGYEGNIISGELFSQNNERKYIPVLRKGDFKTSLPKFCEGKTGVNLSGTPYSEEEYNELKMTILGKKKKPSVNKEKLEKKKLQKKNNNVVEEPLHIIGIIQDEITIPKMDGSRGSALYTVPFRLSDTPSELWVQLFIEQWNNPTVFTTMHRPGIASVVGSKIILDGTTIDEVKKYHKKTLEVCVKEANKIEKNIVTNEIKKEKEEEKRIQQHYQHVQDIITDMEF